MWDAVVIGAGMAGLGAARTLQNEGLRVVVLEARDRAGGRIHSVSLPGDGTEELPPVDVDLGANYLIGCSNVQAEQPLFHVARLTRVETVVCAGDVNKKYRGWECAEISAWRDHQSGRQLSRNEVGQMVFLFDKCLHRAQWILRKETFASSVGELLERALSEVLTLECEHKIRETAELSPIERGTFDSLVSRYVTYVNPPERLPVSLLGELFSGSNTDFDDRLNIMYPPEPYRVAYHESVEKKFSALSRHKPVVAKATTVRWEDRLVTGRFSQIVDAIRDGVEIIYSTRVQEIDWSNSTGAGEDSPAVVVRTLDNDNKPQEFPCKYCIVTVPVGVLKGLSSKSSITFTPQLPAAKREAINRLGIPHLGAATHNKVILRYRTDEVFWDVDAPHLKCTDPRLHILNLHRYGKPGVLLAHIWGGSGLNTQGKRDEEVVSVLTDLLEGMYGGGPRPLPKVFDFIVTRWSEDPFSLGAYTAGEPGSGDEDRKVYRTSLPSEDNPRLMFAGEGTLTSHEPKECTHGALQSGFDRAVRLVSLFHPNRRIPTWKIAHYLLGRVKSKEEICSVKTRRRTLLNNKSKTENEELTDSTLSDLSELEMGATPCKVRCRPSSSNGLCRVTSIELGRGSNDLTTSTVTETSSSTSSSSAPASSETLSCVQDSHLEKAKDIPLC